MTDHLNDGVLTAYIDGELSPHDRELVDNHVSQCESCHARLDAARTQRTTISSALGMLSPTAADAPNARRALANLKANPKYGKEMGLMKDMNRNTRRVLIGAVSLLVVIGLFMLAPVRAFASDFLSIFRVERFVVVDVDPARMEEIANAIDQGMYLGDFESVDQAGSTEVASVAEAADLAGFTPRTATSYGDPSYISVSDPISQSFTPDVQSLRQIFVTLGLDPELLPESIDGETFTFNVDSGVAMGYGGDGYDFMLMQVPSPVIDGPEDADVQALGEAMLQLIGMTPEEAARLSNSIDFTSTLVLPIPTDLASVTEVRVDGESALYFKENSQYNADAGYRTDGGALLWQKDGMVYVVAGANADAATFIEVGNSLN